MTRDVWPITLLDVSSAAGVGDGSMRLVYRVYALATSVRCVDIGINHRKLVNAAKRAMLYFHGPNPASSSIFQHKMLDLGAVTGTSITPLVLGQ